MSENINVSDTHTFTHAHKTKSWERWKCLSDIRWSMVNTLINILSITDWSWNKDDVITTFTRDTSSPVWTAELLYLAEWMCGASSCLDQEETKRNMLVLNNVAHVLMFYCCFIRCSWFHWSFRNMFSSGGAERRSCFKSSFRRFWSSHILVSVSVYLKYSGSQVWLNGVWPVQVWPNGLWLRLHPFVTQWWSTEDECFHE